MDEPGTARTNIASSSDDTSPMEIYEDTPVGDSRLAIALHREKILIGDPVKMAQAMIASCELKPAVRRLVLGSDAYQHIEASLVERLHFYVRKRSSLSRRIWVCKPMISVH